MPKTTYYYYYHYYYLFYLLWLRFYQNSNTSYDCYYYNYILVARRGAQMSGPGMPEQTRQPLLHRRGESF